MSLQSRRVFLQRAGAASTVVALSTFGGCTEATDAVTGGGLEVVEYRGDWTTWGNAEIMVTVENTASESKSGTLHVKLSLDNGNTYTDSQYIRLPGETSEIYEFTIDVSIVGAISSDEATINAWVD